MHTHILFLSADPSNASRLRLGHEFREIQERLRLAKLWNTLTLSERTSVRPKDITQAIFDTEPTIVHFSGHGTEDGNLCFEDELGKVQTVRPVALASLFELLTDQVECVILNACFSENQANAIAEHIDYVIGMKSAIGDDAAINFSAGFYKALGSGRSIENAFKFGLVELKLLDIPETLTPILIKRKTLELPHFATKIRKERIGDTVYSSRSRDYPGLASFELRLNAEEDLRIHVDPKSYESIDSLLYDLYINYLSGIVKPFTYGKSWILTGEPFSKLYVAPWAWVTQPGESISRLCPQWMSQTLLSDQNIEPDSQWVIRVIRNPAESLVSDGFYGIALNDKVLADELLNNAKAIHTLYHEKYLYPRSVDDLDPEKYLYRYVFCDWLGIGLKGLILESTGKSLESKSTRRSLKGRT